MQDVTREQLRRDRALPLIGLVDRQIITHNLGFAERSDVDKDIIKLVVAERHHHTGHIGVCYIKGYGLKAGAIATSIAHDSHNIVAAGVSDEAIAEAINEVKRINGGVVVRGDDGAMDVLRLEIAGLFSDRPIREISDGLEHIKQKAFSLGVHHGVDPFMTLSFLSLPVIPSLRLLTQGAFDVDQFRYVEPIR